MNDIGSAPLDRGSDPPRHRAHADGGRGCRSNHSTPGFSRASGNGLLRTCWGWWWVVGGGPSS